MLKYIYLLFFFVLSLSYSQTEDGSLERYPEFVRCQGVDAEVAESCFEETLRKILYGELQVPEKVRGDGFEGQVAVLFEVTSEGEFVPFFIGTEYPELEQELRRIFSDLPRVGPPTYGGRAINMQFRIAIGIPVEDAGGGFSEEENRGSFSMEGDEVNLSLERNKSEIIIEEVGVVVPGETDGAGFPDTKGVDEVFVEEVYSEEFVSEGEVKNVLLEYERIQSRQFGNPRAGSQINIPLSHEVYSRFEEEVNRVGTNFHTASKPYLYAEVRPYYDFEAAERELYKEKSSWFGRKLWNEHLFVFQGEDYWFTGDFALDLQGGKELDSDFSVTYNNTRAAIFQGGLGEDFNFYTVLFESQGRFAEYFNRIAESIRPDGGDPAIIPGRGIAKPFYETAYDYPAAVGYLSFSPGKFFNLQFGHGKNFIGDGYRSLLLSDAASPYPYFKLTTTFWKLKYTNTWMSLRDVRPEVTGDGSFRTKFMANHYLSYNISKRLNIGLFESVMWENDNNRGFDLNYLNPVIFYRAIEFSTGARAGNAIIGLSAKYKWSDGFNMYGQALIDEFSGADIFGGEQSWKNKLGYQLGFKYFHAFRVPELTLQLEYNQVRPYVYSHNTGTLNYGHNNQSMAHLWGANFRELVGIGRYRKNRYYGSVKLIYGQRGFDFDEAEDDAAYGGDIYTSDVDRPFEKGVRIGQGNTGISFYAEAEAGYIVNPSTNLKMYGNFIFRRFDPRVDSGGVIEDKTVWLNLGIRTDIFNWYFDY